MSKLLQSFGGDKYCWEAYDDHVQLTCAKGFLGRKKQTKAYPYDQILSIDFVSPEVSKMGYIRLRVAGANPDDGGMSFDARWNTETCFAINCISVLIYEKKFATRLYAAMQAQWEALHPQEAAAQEDAARDA